MTTYQQAVTAAAFSAAKTTNAVRHKCFLSYHLEDDAEVAAFIEEFDEVLIPRVIGLTEDSLIAADTNVGVMRAIRENYLTDSTVTIVMIGKCTWARKFVDWEIASTLRNDSNNKRSGLIGIQLPSAQHGPQVPARLAANLSTDGNAYARYYAYPTSTTSIRTRIEDAFVARDDATRVASIDNTAPLRERNSACS